MFTKIRFCIGNKNIEFEKFSFPLGEITASVLNITPEVYHKLKDKLSLAKEKAEGNPCYSLLKESFVSNTDFNVGFYPFKKCVSNSDYKRFEQGVCCVACKESKKGILYTPYIHTKKDVVADCKNVEFLANCSAAYIDKI